MVVIALFAEIGSESVGHDQPSGSIVHLKQSRVWIEIMEWAVER
jgi:hypothetical protein